MNNIMKGSLFFIAGAAIASLITYKVAEKKFKKIADEEIASVKKMYKQKLDLSEFHKKEEQKIQDEKEQVEKTTEMNQYKSLIRESNYSNNGDEKEEEKEDMNTYSNIEVIPPEDFGELDYKRESLTYYADKILAYDTGNIIDEKEKNKLIGPNALNTFGEYEDDSVFVRNHGKKVDYEILLDTRNFFDVYPSISDTDFDD